MAGKQVPIVYQICNSDGSRRQSVSGIFAGKGDGETWEVRLPVEVHHIPDVGDMILPQASLPSDRKPRRVTAVAGPTDDGTFTLTCEVK